MKNLVEDFTLIYQEAIRAVSPFAAVENILKLDGNILQIIQKNNVVEKYDLDSFENIYVVGAGKATAPMAKAVENMIKRKIEGLVIVKYGYTEKLENISLIEAAHPVPDENGLIGAEKIAEILENATEHDLVISLISGGGSALMPLPPQKITLQDKQKTTDVLLKCGATIHEMNAIRKHLSLLKGGGAARLAYPAEVINIMISDVVGDDMDVIASGPFVPDSSTFAGALAIVDKYELQKDIPGSVIEYLKEGVDGKVAETPKATDLCFSKMKNIIAASNIISLQAAARKAVELGYNTTILSSMIEGEAEDVALVHSAIAKEVLLTENPLKKPACILSGGEVTVTIKGKGLGGRNMEFAMHSIKQVAGFKNVLLASIGTDGGDGPTDAAGAYVTDNSYALCREKSIDIEKYIEENDSYHLFEKSGHLIKTGPTNTNVMDIRIVLVSD